MKVLLVDDEEDLVSTMVERLAFRGIEACYATRGTRALELVRDPEIKVAVLDLKMPGLSGVELMERMKELRTDLRFIFLTGHGSEDDYHTCKRAGVNDYLVKPVQLDALIETIKEAAQ